MSPGSCMERVRKVGIAYLAAFSLVSFPLSGMILSKGKTSALHSVCCIAVFSGVHGVGWEGCGCGRGSLPNCLGRARGDDCCCIAHSLQIWSKHAGSLTIWCKELWITVLLLWSSQFMGMYTCARLGKLQRHSYSGFQMHVPSATQFSSSSYMEKCVCVSLWKILYKYLYTCAHTSISEWERHSLGVTLLIPFKETMYWLSQYACK